MLAAGMMEGLTAGSIAGCSFDALSSRRPVTSRPEKLFHSQAHTSATFAAQATNRTTVSVSWTRAHEVWSIVLMAGNIRRF
jgi:hypothetical protein